MITLSPERGMVSLDGTWRCLSILSCVGCSDAFMTLFACPHVGHYLVGHLTVSYLMSSTTHLMRIKCGDSAYLLTRAARPHTIYPPRGGLDLCISPLIGDVLNVLCFPYKFSPHNSPSINPAQHKPGWDGLLFIRFISRLPCWCSGFVWPLVFCVLIWWVWSSARCLVWRHDCTLTVAPLSKSWWASFNAACPSRFHFPVYKYPFFSSKTSTCLSFAQILALTIPLCLVPSTPPRMKGFALTVKNR